MRQKKGTPKNDHAGLLALVLLIAVFGGVAFLVASPPASHSGSQAQASTATLGQRSQTGSARTQVEDSFFGSIVNVPFRDDAKGTVKADTNCKAVEKGLTNCTAIIAGADGTELHFNYSHDICQSRHASLQATR